MWRWDQGRLDYFQFDSLRRIAKFAVGNDLRRATAQELQSATGLPFLPQQEAYRPWRNYGRAFRLAMLAVPAGQGGSQLTEVGHLLSQDGGVTADEYFHFMAEASTDPSPALAAQSWQEFRTLNPHARPRYPLLFILKYLLARASQGSISTSIHDALDAYDASGFLGDEDREDYLRLVRSPLAQKLRKTRRQASESIRVLAQISYLTATPDEVTVSLAAKDAERLFAGLTPISGPFSNDPAEEILRRSRLMRHAVAALDLDYSATLTSDVEQAGFSEGNRVKRTHLTLERNVRLRQAFFAANPTSVCDFCEMDTKRQYPWTSKVLDIHHLLPLCSGARTSPEGTVLEDLVANCPTCHRAVHRYYDRWLRDNHRQDFADAPEAREVYFQARQTYRGQPDAAG